jgi:hypothetical protein
MTEMNALFVIIKRQHKNMPRKIYFTLMVLTLRYKVSYYSGTLILLLALFQFSGSPGQHLGK